MALSEWESERLGEISNRAELTVDLLIEIRDLLKTRSADLVSRLAAEAYLPVTSKECLENSAAREEAWRSFCNSEPAPTHKDCFYAGWAAGKGYGKAKQPTAERRSVNNDTFAKWPEAQTLTVSQALELLKTLIRKAETTGMLIVLKEIYNTLVEESLRE